MPTSPQPKFGGPQPQLDIHQVATYSQKTWVQGQRSTTKGMRHDLKMFWCRKYCCESISGDIQVSVHKNQPCAKDLHNLSSPAARFSNSVKISSQNDTNHRLSQNECRYFMKNRMAGVTWMKLMLPLYRD